MATSLTTYSMVPTVSQNSTFNQVADEQHQVQLDVTSAARIVLIAVFIAFGFFGNASLIITIVLSRKFRSISFFAFVVNLAVVNILECAVNMSILLATSVTNEWTFGRKACRMNAFFLNFMQTEIILGLTISSTDRLIAVCYKEKYDHVVSRSMIGILITATWIQSFAFSVPLAAGTVPTDFNTTMLYCRISEGSSIIYNCFAVLLCFLGPLVVMIIFFVTIVRTSCQDRLLIRSRLSQHNYNEDNAHAPRIKREIQHTNMTVTICSAWLLLQGPYLANSFWIQFQHTFEIQKITKRDITNSMWVDLALFLVYLSYVLALPITAFTWNKNIWKSFKNVIICRKNNLVFDESFKKNEKNICLEINIKEKMNGKDSMMHLQERRMFQVPVLFATSHGVRIQTYSNNVSEVETNKGTMHRGLRGQNCDVMGSQDNLNAVEDETSSEHDSGNEIDSLSLSHPISLMHIHKDRLPDRCRSLPETAIGNTQQIVNKNYDQSVGSILEGDSGLELSSSHLTTIIAEE